MFTASDSQISLQDFVLIVQTIGVSGLLGTTWSHNQGLIFIIPAPHCPGNITAKPLTLVFGRFVLHKKNILIASDLICL